MFRFIVPLILRHFYFWIKQLIDSFDFTAKIRYNDIQNSWCIICKTERRFGVMNADLLLGATSETLKCLWICWNIVSNQICIVGFFCLFIFFYEWIHVSYIKLLPAPKAIKHCKNLDFFPHICLLLLEEAKTEMTNKNYNCILVFPKKYISVECKFAVVFCISILFECLC